MRLLLLAPLLAGCAFLTPARSPVVIYESPPNLKVTDPGPLVASVDVKETRAGSAVPVTLTLRNAGRVPLELEYSAQVNYGACGYPPYVALKDVNGQLVRAPAAAQLTCSQVRLSRTLPPDQTLVLRRALPNPGVGTFTLSAWFDGVVDGRPNRTVAPETQLTIRP